MNVIQFPSRDLRRHVANAAWLLMANWSTWTWQRIRSMTGQLVDEDARASGIELTREQLEAEIDRIDGEICDALQRRGFVAPYLGGDGDPPGAA